MIRSGVAALIVGIVAAFFGAIGAAQYNSVLQIAFLSDATRHVEDSFLQRSANANARETERPVTLFNLRPTATPSNRAPAVSGANRASIAGILSEIRTLQERPHIVIVDIDVAPIASDFDGEQSRQEQLLYSELARWRAENLVTPLLFARGAGCLLPLQSQGNIPWDTTPYDELIAPTANRSTSIAWTCPTVRPRPDRQVRAMIPVSCAFSDRRMMNPVAVPSPGVWAEALFEAKTTDLDQVYDANNGDWNDHCQAKPRSPDAKRVMPIVPVAASERYQVAWVRGGDLSSIDLNGHIVVIGQDRPGIGDVWSTPGFSRLAGMTLVAEHVRTAENYRGSREMGSMVTVILAFFIGVLASLVYGIGVAARWYILKRWRPARAAQIVTLLIVSPPILILAASGFISFLIVNPIVHALTPQSWGAVFAAGGASYLALLLLDFAQAAMETTPSEESRSEFGDKT